MNDELMRPEELRETLAALHWKPTALSRMLGCVPRTVQRWLRGKYTVPNDVAVWLRRLGHLHAGRPAPDSWRGQSVKIDRAKHPARDPKE
jgi:hypothetical protein